jgi:hypothetical protein
MDFRRLLLFILPLLFCCAAKSQVYPVQLSVQLVPPFSGYIPDYASPGNDNFRILAVFNDF